MAQIPLGTIKSQLKSILDAANTTTASPIDLSANMATRVNRVLKVNLSKIPIQNSFFPCVTFWFDGKTVKPVTISKDMATGKRDSEITLTIAGITWEQVTTSVDSDPSDEQIEYLMENVEEIIRSNHTLGNTVKWCYPTSVTYHTVPNSEQTHMRVGIMNLSLKAFY